MVTLLILEVQVCSIVRVELPMSSEEAWEEMLGEALHGIMCGASKPSIGWMEASVAALAGGRARRRLAKFNDFMLRSAVTLVSEFAHE